MKTAILIVSWVLMALGIVVFFGGPTNAGAILVGASLIAISITQLQPPRPPQI